MSCTTEMLWGSRWSLVMVLNTMRSRSRPVISASSSAIWAASMAICAQPSPAAARCRVETPMLAKTHSSSVQPARARSKSFATASISSLVTTRSGR